MSIEIEQNTELSPLSAELTATAPVHCERRSRLISKVLSPAVRLWLRSQVESVNELHIEISGGDRQILSGYIPHVTIQARQVVYQGISIDRIHLSAEQIRINLGQVIKGKPLRLLEVVPVQASVTLQQSDLTDSLQTPLVANAFIDLLQDWLQGLTVQQPQARLTSGGLTFSAALLSKQQQWVPFQLHTQLQVVEGSKIRFNQPQWISTSPVEAPLPIDRLPEFEIDLGSEVDIQSLALDENQLICQGQINIIP